MSAFLVAEVLKREERKGMPLLGMEEWRLARGKGAAWGRRRRIDIDAGRRLGVLVMLMLDRVIVRMRVGRVGKRM